MKHFLIACVRAQRAHRDAQSHYHTTCGHAAQRMIRGKNYLVWVDGVPHRVKAVDSCRVKITPLEVIE